ncbi:hypothetical protein YPPY59_4383, partial [Yersinia pestis PY-59]
MPQCASGERNRPASRSIR